MTKYTIRRLRKPCDKKLYMVGYGGKCYKDFAKAEQIANEWNTKWGIVTTIFEIADKRK